MVDGNVAKRAAQQHGVVTFEQLRALGVGASTLRTRLARGQWVKAGRSAIRIAGWPLTWESDLMAHVLTAGEAAMASHRSAAALWGVNGYPHEGRVELVVPRSQCIRRKGATIHRSKDIDLVRPAFKSGIPTTPLGRTLLDLGAVVSRRQVLLAIDDARRRKLISWGQLLNTLVRHARKGRDGVGVLRAILDEHFGEVARLDSGFERLVAGLLGQFGLPKPALQHEVRIRGKTYRVDLAYPNAMLAIELDGQIHMRRDVWERDLARQNALMNAGWRVLRFTYRQYRDDPASIVCEVATALKREAKLRQSDI